MTIHVLIIAIDVDWNLAMVFCMGSVPNSTACLIRCPSQARALKSTRSSQYSFALIFVLADVANTSVSHEVNQ